MHVYELYMNNGLIIIYYSKIKKTIDVQHLFLILLFDENFLLIF